jgi:hypothetical protein
MTDNKTNKAFFEEIVKHPKYRLGKGKRKPHNKNGKISFTTTMTPENYEWLVLESTLTGKSASVILGELIQGSKGKK